MLAAAVATGVNLGVLFAARRWLGVDPAEPPLSVTLVATATCGAMILGALVLAFLGQTQARPFTIFRRLAAVGFVLVGAAAVLAYLGWLPSLAPVSSTVLFVMVGMDAVAAVTAVGFFTTLPRARAYVATY